MLYKNNGGKTWWVMFRDPRRPGKFIRKSTGTTVLADARNIERAEHLAIKGKISEKQLASIFDSIYGKEREREGLPVSAANSAVSKRRLAPWNRPVFADTNYDTNKERNKRNKRKTLYFHPTKPRFLVMRQKF